MRPLDIFSFYNLLQNQWLNSLKLRSIQDRKLRLLVKHVYTHVPYYRNLFDSVGITPESISGVEDLYKIPVTSRDTLMGQDRENILAKGLDENRCKSTKTSGSTRTPLRIVYRNNDLSLMNMGWARAYFAHGIRPWHRITEFASPRYSQRRRSWYEYLGLMRRKILASSADADIWISELRKWQPHALIGYSSTLKLLAKAIQKQKITDINPQVVFSCSEILDNETRQLLLSTFRCKVIDIYGSEEGRCIAWECDECGGYHINSDLLIVEFLRDGKPVREGEEGEIVITNLHSYAMPFIRYRQEDVGVPIGKKSICGRELPLMSILEGRIDDFVVLIDGRKVSPQIFYYSIVPVRGIGQWRVVQENVGELRVEIVLSRKALEKPQRWKTKGKIKYQISQNLIQSIGKQLNVTVQFVDMLPQIPGEKFRSVVSKLENIASIF
jgi:phenylacetate-CoA ligase